MNSPFLLWYKPLLNANIFARTKRIKYESAFNRRYGMEQGAENYRRFLDGDDTGLRALIEQFSDGLILYLNTYTHDLTVAEEVMEDVFVKLAVRQPRYTGKASFKTWLYTIARHQAVDTLRRQARRHTVPLETHGDLSDEALLDQRMFIAESKAQLHRALQSLPDSYRQILWLIYFEDMTAAEAGKVMGKNTRAAQSLLFRARQALKTQLEKDGFVYEDI